MKNLKKVLSVLLVVAMLATAMVPAFAAETFTYESQAKALYDIGLFKGTSPTEYVPDLGGDLVREQGIAMIVRLLGKADAAAALTAADQDAALAAFADAKDVEPTLKAAVAYAVKNDLVKGDGKNVDPKGKMPGKDFATILLRNLGYEVTAADYDKACATLVEKGGLTAAEAVKFSEKNLIRDDFVGMSYGALQAAYKDGGTVIAKLVADKVVDADKAEKAGVYKPAALTAKVVGAKKFELAFGTAIDPAKITVTVKKGASSYNVESVAPAADKKSVVVTIGNPIVKGDYEISVAGVADAALTAKVTAENEKVAKIEFGSDSAVLEALNKYDKVGVSYKVLNQYNEDVTSKKWSNIVFTPSKGEKNITSGKIVLTSVNSLQDFTIGEKLTISATYLDAENGTNVFASQIFTVAMMAQVADIKVVELYNANKDELNVNASYGDFKLIVEAKDQYGNDIAYSNLAGGLIVQPTDTSVVKVASVFEEVTVDGVKKTALSLVEPDSKKAGTSDVMFVSKFSPKSAKFTVTVKDVSKIDTLTLQSPDFPVAGEVVKIPYTAVDQFGNEITKLSGLVMNGEKEKAFTVTGADAEVKFEQDPVSGKPVLNLDARKVTEKKTVYITGTTSTYKFVNFSVSLQDPAKLEAIAGVKSDFKTNILKQNDATTIKYDQILLKDSYGRDVSKDDAVSKYGFGTKYRYTVESSDRNKLSFPTVAGEVYATITDTTYPTLATGAKGSSTMKVVLQKYDADLKDSKGDKVGGWVNVSETSFAMAVVEKDAIQSYTVNDIASIYEAATYNGVSYSTEVKVEGVLANGKKVAIPRELKTVTGATYEAFFINPSSDLTVTGANIASNIDLDDDKEKTVNYSVTILADGNAQTVEKTTKISAVVPAAATMSLYSTSDILGNVRDSKAGYPGTLATPTAAATGYGTYVKEADTVASIDYTLATNKTDVSNFAKQVVKVVDQYGKTLSASDAKVIVSNVKDQNSKVVDADGTYGKGYSAYVTVVTTNGKSFSFTLAIK